MQIKIESIRLTNFKAFKDVHMRDMPQMCVVVGANGAGKSTLFDVFGFLRDSLTDNVQVALSKRGGFKEVKTPRLSPARITRIKGRFFIAHNSGMAHEQPYPIRSHGYHCRNRLPCCISFDGRW